MARLDSSDEDFNASLQLLDSQLDQLTLTVGGNIINTANSQAAVTTLELTDETHSADIAEVMSDVETLTGSVNDVDGRLGKLELSETVAFDVDLDTYDSIPKGSVVVYRDIRLNLGNGYNKDTGEFTVPNGAAGLYYFYASFSINAEEFSLFEIEHNNMGIMCTVNGNADSGFCGFTVILLEGKTRLIHI